MGFGLQQGRLWLLGHWVESMVSCGLCSHVLQLRASHAKMQQCLGDVNGRFQLYRL